MRTFSDVNVLAGAVFALTIAIVAWFSNSTLMFCGWLVSEVVRFLGRVTI